MSSYEDYDNTSNNYDGTRRPVGIDQVLAWLGRAGALDASHMLDAGCGTGQFIGVMLPHVAKVTGVDLNGGMLGQARAKFEDDSRVDLHQGRIDDLPFEANSFDGAVINQVLHHLPDGADHALHRAIFADIRRVVRPGGTLVINTCAQQQLYDGYWYFNLMPRGSIDQMASRYVSLDALETLLREVGFESIERHAPVDEVIQAQSYFDARGPLDKAWRDGDSTWALLSAEETAAAVARVRELDASGGLEAWMRDADASRAGVGQVTLIAAS